MIFPQTVIGQKHKWSLLSKLGEGDAGEVYLVESLLEGRPAILKRPRRGAFAGESVRQAAQIKHEGQILSALHTLAFPAHTGNIRVPGLLDQSPAENGVGERFFIVIERAAGFDLGSLSLLIHSGSIDNFNIPDGEENAIFALTFAGFRKFPEAILVRSLWRLLNFLETIHTAEVTVDGIRRYGMIWNDIKPEHVYWEPGEARLTIIDWGNSYFLQKDRITRDRKHSYLDDYTQFFQAFGKFLEDTCPTLHAHLDWPKDVSPAFVLSEGILGFKDRLQDLDRKVAEETEAVRKAASELYGTSRPGVKHLSKSEDLHRRIISYGEVPDCSSAENFHARVALRLVSENNLETFREVCERAAKLRPSNNRKWLLLARAAGIALDSGAGEESNGRNSYARALTAGVTGDWPAFLWELLASIGNEQLPSWWGSLSQDTRQLALNLDKDALTPFVAISQLYYTYQALVLQMEDRQSAAHSEDERRAHEDLSKIFSDEVLRKWREMEPGPPNSGISYQAIENLLDGIESLVPGSREKVSLALSQPKAQAEFVRQAWDRKEFERARKALRMVLIWDPDFRRVIQADRAIMAAPEWLASVRRGAGPDEPFYDFLSTAELKGRILLNRVGRAKWLDTILDALRRLRKGASPADLMIEYPEVSVDLPWLNEYRSREILSLPCTRPLTLERDESRSELPRAVRGIVEGKLAPGEDLSLGEPLDTWLPEARGSSARVFAGVLACQKQKTASVAIKVIRPDQLEYALPLFREEAQILSLLRDVPGITPLIECGYLSIAAGLEFPSEDQHASAAHLRWSLLRYGNEEFPGRHGSAAGVRLAALPGAGEEKPGVQPVEILRCRLHPGLVPSAAGEPPAVDPDLRYPAPCPRPEHRLSRPQDPPLLLGSRNPWGRDDRLEHRKTAAAGSIRC
jgi:serine/threonine protein kinase